MPSVLKSISIGGGLGDGGVGITVGQNHPRDSLTRLGPSCHDDYGIMGVFAIMGI